MWHQGKIIILVLLCATVVMGQENATPEQLRKMYDDSLVQLKTAQDRKNELAAQNEKLNEQVAALTAELERTRMQVSILERESASFAERTFSLRAHMAAWQRFMDYYPRLKARWDAYVGANLFSPSLVEPAPDLVP